MTAENTGARKTLEAEERVQEYTDSHGQRWRKVYFGGGKHLENWLSQTREITNEENIKLEEVDSSAFCCFAGTGEKAFRIWVKTEGG